MEISIVIVNYNVKELLQQAITSIIQAGKNFEYEIFVVDNASTDDSAEMVRDKFPAVRLIENEDNLGFAAANNQALKLARGKFILLINPDTIVQENCFSVILDFFRSNPDCGMVGCKILNPDGSLQLACRRSFPTPWVGFTKIIGLSKIFSKTRLFGRYNLTYLDPDMSYEVEAISGSFMFFRQQIIQDVGFLDDSFFMYGEDLDWCYRIREAGWKIYYLPDTQIIHFKGESSKKSDRDLTLQFYRAMKLFVEKHYQNRYWHVPQWFLMTGIWLRASLTFLGRFFVAVLPGIVDFLLLNLSMLLGIYFGVYWRFGFFPLNDYLIVMLFYSLIWISCLMLTNSYASYKFSSLRTFYGLMIGLILNTSVTFFFNQYAFSRLVVLIAGFFNVVLLAGWRMVFKVLARLNKLPFKNSLGGSLLGRRALIVAPRKSGEKISQLLTNNVDSGYDICGLVVLEQHQSRDDANSIPLLGTVNNLDKIIQKNRVSEIIFSTDQVPFDRILDIIHRTHRKDVNFKLIPSSMDVIIGKASIEYIGDLPL
ncbi:MAG: glycosyltransferase, partial [bacterium]|nr:glycosyltransferase [bacterium]